MRAKILTLAGLVAALAVPTGALAKPPLVEPEEGPDPRGLTLQGSGLARVERPARLREKTIQRAVDAARLEAQSKALRDARRRAVSLARVAGLTLGAAQAVTGRLTDSERFSPESVCWRDRCRVPRFAGASVRVTFATLETSAVSVTGVAVVASGSATRAVRPRRKTNPSVRAALARAQLIADPLALRSAERRASGLARAAALGRGSLFALAEEPPQPFAFNLLNGAFGPGRFCGTVRRRERPRVHRCYVPAVSAVLRLTLVGASGR